MRITELIDAIKHATKRAASGETGATIKRTASYIEKHTGMNRSLRRETEVKSRRDGGKHASGRQKPHNWNRDKHKRRKEQKRRRKQSQKN